MQISPLDCVDVFSVHQYSLMRAMYFFLSFPSRDENIRYIRRYISDISDIDDVRHDINDNRYITDISVLDRYIMEISGLWHMRALI